MLPATCLGDQHAMHKDAYFLPFELADGAEDDEPQMFAAGRRPNLSSLATDYLAKLGIGEGDPGWIDMLWRHVLAISHSPLYVAQNAGGIAADWPRIPLPETAERLRASAQLGRRLAELLDPLRSPPRLPGSVAAVRRTDGKPVQPQQGDLVIDVGWGVLQTGRVFPGRGMYTQRPLIDDELMALANELAAGGIDDGLSAVAAQGAIDVHLNATTYWSAVPVAAWSYKIGGFQVLKKWLSYREHGPDQPSALLGRSLTVSEVREFAQQAQRLTAVVALGPELDANYLAAAAAAVDPKS